MTAVASRLEVTPEGGLTPREGPPSPRSALRAQILVAAWLLLLCGAIAVVFWPGHADLDTTGEMTQAVMGQYQDWHTPTLSALWHVAILAGVKSPGWVLAASLVTLLGGIYLLLRIRLSRPWAVVAASAVLLFPPVLGWAVQVGRDQWFATFIVAGFGLAARATRSSGWPQRIAIAGAVLACFLADAAKQNALPATMALLAGVALIVIGVRWRGWRRPLAAAAIGVVAGIAVFGAQFSFQHNVLHAKTTHIEQALYIYDLASMSRLEGKILLPPSVYPKQDLAYLRAWSNPLDPNALFWGPQAVIQMPLPTQAQLDDLTHAWRTAIRTHPGDYLNVRMQLAERILAIDIPGWFVFEVPPTPPGWAYHTKFPAAHDAAMRWVSLTATIDGYTITGGPWHAVWAYALLLIVGAVRFAVRRRLADTILSLLCVGGLLYGLVLLFVAPVVAWRYMYAVVVMGAVVGVLLAIDLGRLIVGRVRGAQ